ETHAVMEQPDRKFSSAIEIQRVGENHFVRVRTHIGDETGTEDQKNEGARKCGPPAGISILGGASDLISCAKILHGWGRVAQPFPVSKGKTEENCRTVNGQYTSVGRCGPSKSSKGEHNDLSKLAAVVRTGVENGPVDALQSNQRSTT